MGTVCARRGYGAACWVEHRVIESVELETDRRGEEVLVARVRGQSGRGEPVFAVRAAGYDTW